ncbi:bifunctional transcriptional activator/DNA repair enzyme AdaA [Paenibacillus sp. NEAU-GSW1]|uniref:bifunctional transcriptional activator/DNA repair enzyme AdaA n=1 Tax=Paenibacillus sp. NEAU-GSW1 TaxID=2682486 RepID=UPI0012E18E3F|nr:bifunctional transcriptional activator/DNA repair enzyme AdaA [Paenibacillus sp. NEAU-GSW1]MUT65722.1 AraC family transcriptional regulator [Paenibacillus sp. NEAU-GSW1]
MSQASQMPTDEQWQAIKNNDASYNAKFMYAIKTTGIFCKPSCKSRLPNRENVRIFQDADGAQAAQFRPCKRCKPTGERLPDQEWVELISRFIEKHYSEPIRLRDIADACHGSAFHLQRTFKRIKGITPTEYVQRTRIAKAQQLMNGTNRSIAEIGVAVGMPNTAYFITLFKKMTGSTPSDYRQRGRAGMTNVDAEGSDCQ